MTFRHLLLSTAIVLIALPSGLSFAAPATPVIPSTPPDSTTAGKIREGQIIVRANAGVSDADFIKAMKAKGLKVKQKLNKNAPLWVVEVPAKSEQGAVNDVATHRHVHSAELDRIVQPNAAVTDPSYSSQWALSKIQAPLAWDTSMGAGVTVAVIDSGVNYNHPDLKANMLTGWNFYNNNSDPMDVTGHGTLVAGIIGEASNNGIGGAGVASKVKILPVRVADDAGGGSISRIYQGMYWAYDRGARIINLSWGGITNDPTINAAAQDLQAKGVLVVNGAENSGTLKSYTNTPYLLTVGATNSSDLIWVNSSYGSYVDLSAPGVDVYSTAIGGGYKLVSGTSFSTPMVVAVAALVKSTNPKLSPTAIEQILKDTIDDKGDVGYDIHYGYGRVNAAKAVAKAKSLIDTVAPYMAITNPANGATLTGTVEIKSQAYDNVKVDHVSYYINGVWFGSSKVAPYTVSWNTRSASNGAAIIGAVAVDSAGNVSKPTSVSVTVKNADSDTIPPTIKIISPTTGSNVSGKVNFTVAAADNVKVSHVAYFINGVWFSTTKVAPYTVTWDTSSIAGGSYLIGVIAIDTSGNKSLTPSVTVNVVNPSTPPGGGSAGGTSIGG